MSVNSLAHKTAVIYQHPSSPVNWDYAMREPEPCTPASVARSIQAMEAERAAAGLTQPTEEEWERLAAHEGLANLIQKYSAKRVMRWVRNLAAMYGQEV